MNQKLTVGIIFGGVSSEHEVSRVSATSVRKNLDPEKYSPVMIGISKEGRWFFYDGPIDDIPNGKWESNGHAVPAFISPDRQIHGLVVLTESSYSVVPLDVAFPVLHGLGGEDGTIQGLFELAGIPYVGPKVLASSVCMDKEFAHRILESEHIPMAKWFVARRSDLDDLDALHEKILSRLGGYPVFFKPANAGSSVGVSKVSDPSGLKDALLLGLENDPKVLVEEAVVGKEIECAVIGNDSPVASDCLGEIVPKVEFYDYDAKYNDDATELYVPARIPDEATQAIRRAAVQAYRILNCAGMTRMDFFLKPDGSYILNEANTIPGFTSISMYPKLLIASGYTYASLIDRLLSLALENNGKELPSHG